MPLYTTTHTPASAPAAESPWRTLVRAVATFGLRAGAGVLLAVEHVVPEVVPAWKFVWDREPWAFVATIAGAGAPLPAVVAPAFLVTALLATVSLVAGLITRIGAAVLTALAALAFPTAYAFGYAENAALYTLIFAAIILLGPGVLSLDAILTYRKPPKPKRTLV